MSKSLREWCDQHGEPYGQSMADFLDEEVRYHMSSPVITAPTIWVTCLWPYQVKASVVVGDTDFWDDYCRKCGEKL